MNGVGGVTTSNFLHGNGLFGIALLYHFSVEKYFGLQKSSWWSYLCLYIFFLVCLGLSMAIQSYVDVLACNEYLYHLRQVLLHHAQK